MRRHLLIAVAALALSACGFHLRGSYALPFETLYLGLPKNADLRLALRRNVEATSGTRIVDDAKSAQAVLAVLGDDMAKNVLSLDSAGRVREFQLVRAFSFRIHTADNRDLLPPGRIVIRRDVTFNDAQLLSKESEEALLWRDMEDDLVAQLMRRLAAAKPRLAAD